MKQRTELTRRFGLLSLLGVRVAALTLIAPLAHAVEPVVPGIRPAPRGVAPQKIPPRPTPGVIPKRIPPGGIGIGPTIVRPGTAGPNCRASCGSRCQMVSCSGLNVSQCASARQRCRAACSSRC